MKLDKETREAMIENLYECLEASRTATEKVVAIQLNYRSILPLGNLLPFLDASKVVQDELAKWITHLEHPNETI
jgi:hypothetical protein